MAVKPQRETVGQQIRRKMFATLVPAIGGAFAGYHYAKYTLDPALLEGSTLTAMYASMGAIVGVLGMRIAALGRSMFREFFNR